MAKAYFETIRMKCTGSWIASVSGGSGNYELTLANGQVISGYDETAGNFDTGAPQASDLCTFGLLGTARDVENADVEVIDAADALKWFGVANPAG